MFHDISPQMAGLVSNWLNTLLYGITTVTYSVCIYVLIKRRSERSQIATWVLAATSTIQFVLATIYVVVALSTLIEGFIHTQDIPNGALLYWIDPTTKSQVISNAVYITNSVVGDFILVWRLYMVWGRNIYVCILPIMLTCCTAVTGYVADSKLATITGNVNSSTVFEVLNWILSSWCLSIATQVISTSLIAGIIWWHARLNPVARPRYVSLIIIIVESGAIYTLSAILLLVFAELKTEAGAIPAHMITQIATIVPTLMIIRVELNRSNDTDTSRRLDLTRGRHSVVSQSLAFGSVRREEDSSTKVTMSTLSPSNSPVEIKYAV